MVPALLLVLVFAMGLLVEAIRPLGGSATTVGPKWVDSPTAIRYGEALGSSESTRYNGRVWADKTVYDGDVTIGESGEDTGKILIGDNDFLISYSLLSMTTVVSGQSVVPLDVVFVIDMSSSMADDGKIEQTVSALNQALKTLMGGHPDTRVAVVTYGIQAEVLLPLDHYSKVNDQDYFSLSGVDEEQSLCASVKNSNDEYVEKKVQMSQYTNIHMGIDTGMDLLLNANTTTESGIDRHPVLMLMSDGAPTCAGSEDSSWWDPSGVGSSGYDIGEYSLTAIMNASYKKAQVTNRYQTDMQVYTVGVGIEEFVVDDDKVSAYVTLNPEEGMKSDSWIVKNIVSAWTDYLAGKEPVLGNYTFTHPPKDDISSLFYTDDYIPVSNSSGISQAFETVLNQIIVSGAVPTEVGDDPRNSGYITYTDLIGEYMEVTEVKAIVWQGRVYQLPKNGVTHNGNVTTYTFNQGMTSPIYGAQSFSDISITVTTDEETKDQVLVVQIPAALIPLRKNEVELNDDGTVASNVCANNTPFQLFYTVSVRDEVLTKDKKIDLSKIDSAYIAEHTTECGDVLFYSNLYPGDTQDQAGVEKTVGTATVSFVPAANNPFYFNQSKTLLYADEECDTPAKKGVSPVYVKVPYYSGTEKTYGVVKRPYDEAYMTPGADGYLYLNAKAPCYLGGLIIDKGAGNVTKTAETYHYPIYVDPESGTTYSSETSKTTRGIQLHLGNNGALKADIPTGDLTISKTVTGNMGEMKRGFLFDIAVYHTDGQGRADLDGTYVATRTGDKERPSTEPSTQPGTGTSVESNVTSGTEPEVSPSAEPTPSQPPIDAECPEPSLNPGEEAIRFVEGKAQVTLSHGESITVHDLPAGYTYVVTEQDPKPGIEVYNDEDYFVSVTQSSSPRGEDGTTNSDVVAEANTSVYTCTGTIQADRVETVAYTNYLEVPIADITFTKVDGFDFNSEDTAKITPLPGAEFRLYRYMGESWETDKGTTINPSSEYAIWKQMGDAVLSDENGVVTFTELQAGNYRLVETSAPDGYQLPDGQWNITLTISKEDSGYVGDIGAPEAVERPPAFSEVDGIYYLINYKPINPPVTGGDGGEDFRIGGGLLMFTGLVLAMWWMWSSPRRRSEFL